jgi:spore germination cell wall hydrolase CwlJ-like protein
MIGFATAAACLALNIYWEAGDEPLLGRYAVAFVTLNRVRSRNLDVCGVVFQDHQFSWTNNAINIHGKMKPEFRPQETHEWRMAQRIAKDVLNGNQSDFTHGATFYYADYIPPPNWVRNMDYKGKWGKHYFFKRKGTKWKRKH